MRDERGQRERTEQSGEQAIEARPLVYAVSLCLPLTLLLVSVLSPSTVDFLLRNPCLRFRLSTFGV